jgi:hypothetical protein
MKIYQDKSITEQTFVLEETVFINCVLKNCDLFYAGGDFEIVNLRLENCRIHFRGPAKSTQMMMLTLGMLKAPLQLPPSATSSTKSN